MKAITIKVIGKVQGVWFRASTQQKAQELGLLGTVRNLKDGSVWIEVQGDEFVLDQFLEWCKIGPPHAIVQECVVEEATIIDVTGFEIIR